jgi:class 3 adenylate cyclase
MPAILSHASGATVPWSGGDAGLKRRDTVQRMQMFEALRERVPDRFEALGPTGPKGVADPVPLFRAASS